MGVWILGEELGVGVGHVGARGPWAVLYGASVEAYPRCQTLLTQQWTISPPSPAPTPSLPRRNARSVSRSPKSSSMTPREGLPAPPTPSPPPHLLQGLSYRLPQAQARKGRRCPQEGPGTRQATPSRCPARGRSFRPLLHLIGLTLVRSNAACSAKKLLKTPTG